MEKYDIAIDKFTEIYVAHAHFHDALISRGNVYVDYGNSEGFAKAERDYDHVLLRDSNNLDAHINLAYLNQINGRFQRAWNQLTKALQIRNDFAPIYEARAIVCLQMSDVHAALKDINQAIKLSKTAELYVNRGVIYQVIYFCHSSSILI